MHHQLVALAVCRELGHDVVGLLVVVRGGDGGVELHARGDVLLDEASEPVVVLGGHRDRGRRQRGAGLPVPGALGEHERTLHRDRRWRARPSTPSAERKRHSSS